LLPDRSQALKLKGCEGRGGEGLHPPAAAGGDSPRPCWSTSCGLTVNQYVDNPKSEPKLNTARERLARLRQEVALLKAGDLHEAMKAVEVQAILDCAEIVVAASLERKESRWGALP